MIILISIFILMMAVLIYKRYFPVIGVPFINLNSTDVENMMVLDMRDFNKSYSNPVKGAVNIPIAYLNRNIDDIPTGEIYVIASSPLERNLGIRMLRKKGFRVVGYSIYDANNSFKLNNCA